MSANKIGLLSKGQPLSWPETKKNAELVRRVGVKQFLAHYHRLKDRRGDILKWGDEVRGVMSWLFSFLGEGNSILYHYIRTFLLDKISTVTQTYLFNQDSFVPMPSNVVRIILPLKSGHFSFWTLFLCPISVHLRLPPHCQSVYLVDGYKVMVPPPNFITQWTPL